MNEQIKYIQVDVHPNWECEIISSLFSNVRVIRQNNKEALLKDKVTEVAISLKPNEILDLAYLLIEAHFKMFANDKSTEIEIKIKRD